MHEVAKYHPRAWKRYKASLGVTPPGMTIYCEASRLKSICSFMYRLTILLKGERKALCLSPWIQ